MPCRSPPGRMTLSWSTWPPATIPCCRFELYLIVFVGKCFNRVFFSCSIDPVQDRVRERAQAAAARQARKGAKDQFLRQVRIFPGRNIIFQKKNIFLYFSESTLLLRNRGWGEARSVQSTSPEASRTRRRCQPRGESKTVGFFNISGNSLQNLIKHFFFQLPEGGVQGGGGRRDAKHLK